MSLRLFIIAATLSVAEVFAQASAEYLSSTGRTVLLLTPEEEKTADTGGYDLVLVPQADEARPAGDNTILINVVGPHASGKTDLATQLSTFTRSKGQVTLLIDNEGGETDENKLGYDVVIEVKNVPAEAKAAEDQDQTTPDAANVAAQNASPAQQTAASATM